MRAYAPMSALLGSALILGASLSLHASSSDAPPSSSSPSAKSARDWWAPGEGRKFPESLTYANDWGDLGLYLEGGELDTKGHAFFEPLGANGRACVSCHQPADGMSLSVKSVQERWRDTKGKDPIFSPIDGANCPNLPADDPASHSLLLTRGLFRIGLPWPPKNQDGQTIDPEFTIEVVRDPTGCNKSETYGLNSANPTISVYRRPRVVANTKYTTHQRFGVSPFIGKNGLPTARDPDTGRPVSMNLMSDARHPTLKMQALDAAAVHLGFVGRLSPAQLAQIENFERRIYAAQARLIQAGSLTEPDGPPAFGPRNLAKGDAGVLGNNTRLFVFPMGDAWTKPDPKESAEQREKRASIRRGHDVFFYRTFWIKDSMHLNTVGLGNPTKRTCATCHGMHMTGMDSANGWMDIGTTNLPWATEVPANPWNNRRPEMPLFKITCKPGVLPHPYLGRVFYTQDPGRALISGKCDDVGTMVMQQFRGLASRAPYFTNGSAKNIRELIDFYDRRYNIQFSEQERLDLETFMASL